MTCHQISDKPLSEPVLAWFVDACMRHSTPMSQAETYNLSTLYLIYMPAWDFEIEYFLKLPK